MSFIEGKGYDIEFVIKQGYYNFLFAIPGDEGDMDTMPIEGRHTETENDYTVLVYQTVPGEGYDRIIGKYTANTINKK